MNPESLILRALQAPLSEEARRYAVDYLSGVRGSAPSIGVQQIALNMAAAPTTPFETPEWRATFYTSCVLTPLFAGNAPQSHVVESLEKALDALLP